jgi:tRNA-dihydrouridine synthase
LTKLYLAPMEGLTYVEYRQAWHQCFEDFDQYFTPFAAPGRWHLSDFSAREKRDIGLTANEGMNFAVQLLTKDPDAFASVGRELANAGYREVNINLGCPSPTVTAKGRGAGMLKDPDALNDFLEDVFMEMEGADIRISAKTRIGYDSAEELPALMDVFNRYPFAQIIVHPRTGRQGYTGKPDWDSFAYVISHSRNPVAYNGDIRTAEDFLALKKRFPDLQAVMLGRGALSDPWLPEKIRAAEKKEIWQDPGEDARRAKLRQFHDLVFENYLEAFDCKNGVVDRMKELWGWMGAALPGHEKDMKAIRKAKRLPEYRAAVRVLLS